MNRKQIIETIIEMLSDKDSYNRLWVYKNDESWIWKFDMFYRTLEGPYTADMRNYLEHINWYNK